MNKKIIVFGCGGHSRSVVDILLSCSDNIDVVFVDENASYGEVIYNFPVVQNIEINGESYFYGIGDNLKRKEKFDTYGSSNLISVVSPQSYKGYGTEIGKGCFIGNFCHIGPQVSIGHNTIINNGASIDHEVVVGNHCHIGPNSTISGRTVVGDLVFIGVGATIIDKVKICSNVTIGAGAVVVDDIIESGIYVGVPARKSSEFIK